MFETKRGFVFIRSIFRSTIAFIVAEHVGIICLSEDKLRELAMSMCSHLVIMNASKVQRLASYGF